MSLLDSDYKLMKKVKGVCRFVWEENGCTSGIRQSRELEELVVNYLVDFNNREFPVDDFPSERQLITQIHYELKSKVDRCLMRYEAKFNPRLSWRPTGQLFVDVWIKSNFPIFIFRSGPYKDAWINPYIST